MNIDSISKENQCVNTRSNNSSTLPKMMIDKANIVDENHDVQRGGRSKTLGASKNESMWTRENAKLIRQYGPDAYCNLKQLEDSTIFPNNYLKRHNIDNNLRTKMIDWMMEVLHVFKCESETIFLSVNIMDLYLLHAKQIIPKDKLHLIGTTAMYMASKFEDIMPISVHSTVTRIAHKKFTANQIIQMEREMYSTINYKIILASTYEFIKTYIYDFVHNNEKRISKYNMMHHINNLESSAIFMAKLMLHDEQFNDVKSSIKSIACITAAFDSIRGHSNQLTTEMEKFTKEWLVFLIKETEWGAEKMMKLYNKLVEYYSSYQNMDNISGNLAKMHKLNYD